jgi:tRNA nucleotidyltransferase/poly(A) polymerase
MEELYDESIRIFINFNNTRKDLFENDINNYKFPEITGDYGKVTLVVDGYNLDIEAMSSFRNIYDKRSFVPTRNITEEALTRNTPINTIVYNIGNSRIEDPLKGIELLKQGILDSTNFTYPLDSNPYIIFNDFKTAAKLSLQISEHLSSYILENNSELKV